MKSLLINLLIILNFVTLLNANSENEFKKVAKCFSAYTNNSVDFDINKTQISIKSANFPTTIAIPIELDEGPIVTTPHFTIAKAGVYAKGSLFDIFKQIDSNNKVLQKIKYKYEAILSFSNNLDSKTTIEALNIVNDEVNITSSNINIKNTIDIDNCQGKSQIVLDKLNISSNNFTISIDNANIQTFIEDNLVEGYALFTKNIIEIQKLTLIDGFKHYNLSFKMDGATIPIDKEFFKSNYNIALKALDADTIANLKAIKDVNLQFSIEGSKTKALLEFMKLNKQLEELQQKIEVASKNSNDIELQKAIFELNSLTSTKMVDILNGLFVKDKTKIALNLTLNGEKQSFVKANLTYKANPLQGNMQTAMISLMAQNLSIFDGDIEINLDKDLAISINPLAPLFIELFKNQGLIDEKNGIYHLKLTLKSGKIIIKGKAYTLQELANINF